VLGVCLGGQVMTLACGGVVERARTAEVGVYELDLLPAVESDPLFRVLPQRVPVTQYHGDEMTEAPQGAVLLASTPDCEIQAYRLGDRAWALQFHPEVDADIVASWAVDDPAPVLACGRTPDSIHATMTERADEMADAWRPFAHAFVDVVRESVHR
jgi:GMP synthase-like glutamine amidotransferase